MILFSLQLSYLFIGLYFVILSLIHLRYQSLKFQLLTKPSSLLALLFPNPFNLIKPSDLFDISNFHFVSVLFHSTSLFSLASFELAINHLTFFIPTSPFGIVPFLSQVPSFCPGLMTTHPAGQSPCSSLQSSLLLFYIC
jgi:hypothetical protein